MSLGPERYALKQMHKAELASRRGLGPEVAFREKVAYPTRRSSLTRLSCTALFTPPRGGGLDGRGDWLCLAAAAARRVYCAGG